MIKFLIDLIDDNMAPIKTRTAIYSTPTHKRGKRNNNGKETVGVYLRLRPLKLEEPSLERIDEQQVKTIPPDGSAPQVYSFTQVFDNAPQSEIFDKVARNVVEDFIKAGKDGLIFTYGITGSGKTYTMEGLKSDPGLIYRTIDFIFNSIGSQQTTKNLIENDGSNSYRIKEEQLYPNLGRSEAQSVLPSVIKWKNRTKETASVGTDPTAYYCLFISLIELYNKKVFDLFEDLNTNSFDKEKKRLEIRTDKMGTSYVANAVEIEVKSADEAVELYTRGVKRRRTGSTALNSESSRGHCVLNLKLVQVRKSYDAQFDEDTITTSQLCLVDLAGSERTKRTGATGGALHEACNINNSLLALRKCIRALRERQPAGYVQYREYGLTHLFKSYFEGHGSVRMILCIKSTAEDFHENNIAMEFGLLTQDVAIDYASPPKMLKRSKSRAQDYAVMYEFLDKKLSHYEPNPDLTDEQFLGNWIDRLKSNRDRRKKFIETSFGAQNEVRRSIINTMTEIEQLRHQFKTRAQDLRSREDHIKMLESKVQLLKKIRSTVWSNTAPSAPELEHSEPLQSSSPMNVPDPSTSDTTEESNAPPTTTNTSSDAMHTDDARSSVKSPLLLSPNSGVPVVNPRHNRSLSCSNMQWIHHKPIGTIETGTVLKPKFKNGRSVRNLRSSDILRKNAAGYSVVHQDADSNGDVETSVYKGHIISTVCGGAQVILNDIETMRQVSPKRKRATIDAHYTH